MNGPTPQTVAALVLIAAAIGSGYGHWLHRVERKILRDELREAARTVGGMAAALPKWSLQRKRADEFVSRWLR